MDNKTKQNFSRQANAKACQSTESNRKSTTDIQSNKGWPRNSRRRENNNNSIASKNDQQRNSKQQISSKVRTNVDKRPRPRGYGCGGGTFSYDSIDSTTTTATKKDDCSAATSTGLALADTTSSLGGAVADDGVCGGLDNNLHLEYELNSVYSPGSKKQNLNHLLNFHYASRESDYSMGISVFGRNGGSSIKNGSRHNYGLTAGGAKRHKYNKEQFMQANFQFVIRSSAKPKFDSSPDILIDWNLIEQINIQTTEEPQCPICLYPPIAAKLTRCGHAYCWPCILHYLALTDKTWRKCPICYEAIHIADLKSTTIVQQQQVKVGDLITFHLMRRKKGSMFIEKYTSLAPTTERYPLCSSNNDAKLFSKFLIANYTDILDIMSREHRELTTGEDKLCPEFVFIQQALDLLNDRRKNLRDIFDNKELNEDENLSEAPTQLSSTAKSLLVELNNYGPENDGAGSIENAAVPIASERQNEISIPNFLAISSTKYYYFYQSADGQNIYLHPLNVKMLQACYGTLDQAPLIINARILQKEHHSMDEDHRRKFTCLGHLPLTCQFAVVEVDLQPPLIKESILKLFKDDIIYRKKERQQREREERKREKKINEINDRQMGKLIASTVNLNLGSSHEFPTFGFEESLTGSNTQEIDTSRSTTISMPNRNVSYSTVAVGESSKLELWPTLATPTTNSYNSYQQLSTWGKQATDTTANRKAPSDRNSECDSLNETSTDLDLNADKYLLPMHTNLGDVLAEALSQKKHVAVEKTNTGVGVVNGNNKKNKKCKKMVPLFSTGMSFNSK